MGLRFQRSFKRLDILDILEWCLGPGMAGISSTLIKYVPFKPTVDVFFNAHIQILKKKNMKTRVSALICLGGWG